MALWYIRILFLAMCAVGGYAASQVQPEFVGHGALGALVGLGFGGALVLVDELLKGFSLRAFSATSFGLLLGSVVAFLLDHSGLLEHLDERPTRWLIRVGLFLSFSYIGIVLAMRSNKEDFSLIIPYVRFAPQHRPEYLWLLDTSVIIDGRIADLIECDFLDGVMVVPRFVLQELQAIGDAADPARRARGRRGLEMLGRIQRSLKVEVRIHDGDFPEESEVDAKLVRLAHNLGAKLLTNDHNLGQIAALQSVRCVNLHEAAKALKPVLLPGEVLALRLVREGRDKGQAVGYLNDGTMVVVNEAQQLIGRPVEVAVQSLHQTGAGVMDFAELKSVPPA